MADEPRDNFGELKTLVAELRGRLPPNLTKRQYDDIGMWMLKACWLGEGKPLNEVFELPTYDEKPKLNVIQGDKT